LAIFGCKRVNYDEMDGDRLRLPANRNCYRLSRVSWAFLKLLVFYRSKQLTDFIYTDIYCKLSKCIWQTPCSYEHYLVLL